MLPRRLLPLVLVIGLLFATATEDALAQAGGPGNPQVGESVTTLAGPAITYQGELKNGGNPVNASCDFQFGLYDAATLGAQQGVTQTVTTGVANGRFTVTLNSAGQFGARAFDGSARWLASSVRCPAGNGVYTSLTPRQFLTAAPLAFALPGLRTEQNATSPNIIGGYISNTVSGGVVGATLSGGGAAGLANTVAADYGTVSGGVGNWAGGSSATVAGGNSNSADSEAATVGGGLGNWAGSFYATVGGGVFNTASGAGAFVGGGGWDGTSIGGNLAAAQASAIVGGWGNSVPLTGSFAAIGGGLQNTASGESTVIGGGVQNTASNSYATVGGGILNTASGGSTFVGGGSQNTAGFAFAVVGGGYGNTASGYAATIAGGYGNIASGDNSFAAGTDARAIHYGAFVWSNETTTPISSTANGQFLVRATGGISLTTNTGGTTGCNLSAGGGTWNCTSDRNAKANFAAVDGVAVLDALMTIPIQTWNFNTQDAGIQHMGPMAQDFYAAYGLGEGELTISTVDADGVALAAIQGLYTVVQQKDAEIAALEARVAALESASAPAGVTVQQTAPAPATNTLQLLVVLVLGAAVGGGLTLGAFALGRRQAAAVKA